jgi:ATP-binding cassette subfamily C protein CydCD
MSGIVIQAGAAARTPGLLGLIPLASTRKLGLILTVLSGLVAQAGTVSGLAAGAWLAGRAVGHASTDILVPGFWWLGLSVLAAAAARWWQAHVSHDFAFALIETLQVGIFDGLERAAPAYVLGRRTGDLAAVATADAELMEQFFAHMLGDYVAAIVVPVGALVGLGFVHWLVALALLPFLPLLASVPLWLARRADAQGRRLAEALGSLNAETVEAIQGQRELAIFGQGRAFIDRIMARADIVAAEQRRFGSRAGLEQAAIDVLLAAAVLCASVVGILLLTGGSLAPAMLPLVIVLAGGALVPVIDVTQTARKLGELRAGGARVLGLFRLKSQVADRGRSAIPADRTIRFDHVRFGYDEERGAVLRDMDFEIGPGEMIALVGRSGAGKSTCANLLLRFWEPDAGRISIGGLDLRDMPLSALRRLVAPVPQDVHLFNASIADNIRLGRPDATPEEIECCARLAQAHDFISALPQGYATVCGERGTRLSGGQRQRIAIARAFLRDAPILILDEAVSNLDSENERALQAAIAEARRGRTVVVIAHRPSTIRAADRILVLDDGRIVESGSHDALLARGGAYAELLAVRNAVD